LVARRRQSGLRPDCLKNCGGLALHSFRHSQFFSFI
jgi:hypothetical protein